MSTVYILVYAHSAAAMQSIHYNMMLVMMHSTQHIQHVLTVILHAMYYYVCMSTVYILVYAHSAAAMQSNRYTCC